jgi:hypothetical protein
MAIPNSDRLPSWISANVPEELVSSSLFRFKVSLQVPDPEDSTKKKRIVVDILPDLEIDMEILEEQMQDIPAQYAFWSAVYSELRLAVAVAERKLKKRRGEAIDAIQKEMVANKTKISVDVQKMIVEMDGPLIESDLKLAQAQMFAGKIWHMVKALEMKHEVCRSLIGLKKAEHERS